MRSFFYDLDDQGARDAFALAPSDTINAQVLAAGVAEVHTIPTGAKYVSFAATADFYAKFGSSSGAAAAAVPSTEVTNGTGSELNPGPRRIPVGMTHIGLISETICKITLSFYD